MTVIGRREVDDLGRITLPPAIRASLQIESGDSFSVGMNGNVILLFPEARHCALCQATGYLIEVNGRFICQTCLDTVAALKRKERRKRSG